MSYQKNQPLSIIADVSVNVSPLAVAPPAFNQAAIGGISGRFVGNPKKYLAATYSTAMAADGFLPDDPEMIVATMYFSQAPAPKILWVFQATVDQTPLQACQAARAACSSYWGFMFAGATDMDHRAIATWAQAQVGLYYFGTSMQGDVLAHSDTSVFALLYGAKTSRTWLQYASTQDGLYASQAYFTAAVMGCAMAANTQLAASAFTMKFSAGVDLVGVYTEPLDINTIDYIESLGGNLYVNYNDAFDVLEPGTSMAPGVFFDEVLNLDVLAANMQYNVLNKLRSLPKVWQTDGDQIKLIQAVEAACVASASTGFIANGVWQGQTIPGFITNGETLATGFKVWSPKYKTQNPDDRQARKGMPIYVALIEAGAVHSVIIAVNVQR